MKGLIFTYVLTYGGALISLFNPFYGLLIYICFAILKPPALWPWSVPVGNYSRIIGIAFLIGWAVNGFGDGRLGKTKPIVFAMLGYFLWIVLSTLFSPHPELGFPIIEYMAKTILPFVAGVTLIRTWEQLKQLLWVIVGSCAYLSYEANLIYLSGRDTSRGQLLIGLDNNSISILIATSFGLAIVMALEETVAWRRYLCFGIAAAMAHVPMFSMSRGGMLGILVSSIVAAIMVPKNARTWGFILAAIFVGSILAGPSVIDEFATSFKEESELDESARGRIDLWRDCTDAMLKHPWFGLGVAHWPLVAESYGWTKGKAAHSTWFQTGAELGVPGLLFLLAFYALTLLAMFRIARNKGPGDDPLPAMLARMVIASLAGFIASASFVTVDGYELPYYVGLIGACTIKLWHTDEMFFWTQSGELRSDLPLHST
jgi:O-antigen ligase